MYKRIIAAVDGSSVSKAALREAVKLAKTSPSTLRIVHVVDLVNINVETPADEREYEESVCRAGERTLKEAAALARKAGVNAEIRLLEVQQMNDRIADEIGREARKWRADLIVVGTHGRRGLSHLFLGSVAETITRVAPVPVLLVRGK